MDLTFRRKRNGDIIVYLTWDGKLDEPLKTFPKMQLARSLVSKKRCTTKTKKLQWNMKGKSRSLMVVK